MDNPARGLASDKQAGGEKHPQTMKQADQNVPESSGQIIASFTGLPVTYLLNVCVLQQITRISECG